MKSNRVFKRAFNDTLGLLSKLEAGEMLPTESKLAKEMQVSRTTVRKVLATLEKERVVAIERGNSRLLDTALDAHRFPETETLLVSAQVEKQFMEWMLRDNAAPGTVLNERQLSQEFGVATSAIREFLNRFQSFGLIERRPHGGWLLKGFTIDFALELFEVREMYELRSAHAFGALPESSALWWQLASVEREHIALLGDTQDRFNDFSDLDNRFHRLINSAAPNRFIDGFYDVISLVFHYHYQWNKADEAARNEYALREHLDYIQALKGRDKIAIEKACRTHLRSAKSTLVKATLTQ